MTFLFYFTIALFVILCFVLCSVILMQESKSSGLGASFGGDSGDSLFGASTADVLKRFTGWVVIIFLVSSFFLSFWTESLGRYQGRATDAPIEQIEQSQK